MENLIGYTYFALVIDHFDFFFLNRDEGEKKEEREFLKNMLCFASNYYFSLLLCHNPSTSYNPFSAETSYS